MEAEVSVTVGQSQKSRGTEAPGPLHSHAATSHNLYYHSSQDAPACATSSHPASDGLVICPGSPDEPVASRGLGLVSADRGAVPGAEWLRAQQSKPRGVEVVQQPCVMHKPSFYLSLAGGEAAAVAERGEAGFPWLFSCPSPWSAGRWEPGGPRSPHLASLQQKSLSFLRSLKVCPAPAVGAADRCVPLAPSVWGRLGAAFALRLSRGLQPETVGPRAWQGYSWGAGRGAEVGGRPGPGRPARRGSRQGSQPPAGEGPACLGPSGTLWEGACSWMWHCLPFWSEGLRGLGGCGLGPGV